MGEGAMDGYDVAQYCTAGELVRRSERERGAQTAEPPQVRGRRNSYGYARAVGKPNRGGEVSQSNTSRENDDIDAHSASRVPN